MPRWISLPLAALTAVLALAAPAAASTVIGHTGAEVYGCPQGYEVADTDYVVPAGGGTITHLSFAQTAVNAGQRVDLNVLRPNADGTYTVVGGTGLQTLDGAPGVRSFPVDIRVDGGEVLGLFTDSLLLTNCLQAGDDMLPFAYLGMDPTRGTTFFIDETDGGFALNMSATLSSGPTAAGRGTADAPVYAPQSFDGPLADVTGEDLSATIDWGDGSSSDGVADGGVVTGTHRFAATGPYTVTVHVADRDGATADATTHLLVYGTPASGTFVVGERGAFGTATFAGAQWAKRNGGPAAFKGYAGGGAPACGAAIDGRPGDRMPSAVPAYMAVAVSGDLAKHGAAFTGTVDKVVIVRADPGALGTGAVIATLCGDS